MRSGRFTGFQNNVSGFDVTMHDTVGMRRFQCAGDCPDNHQRFGRGQWTSFEFVGEGFTFEPFHGYPGFTRG